MPAKKTTTPPPTPTFFATPAAFRKWLEKHHDSAAELWVGYYKKDSGKPSITWQESVDEALCFGWIDGIVKSLDAESYMHRLTPRRKGSTWSNVNIRRAQELIEEGRMRPAGLAAFERRTADNSGIYKYEQPAKQRTVVPFSPEVEARFRKQKKAWQFWEAQPPGYRKMFTDWVMSAKREETRERRLETLIRHSAAGRRVDPLKPNAEP